ncbi:FISUMP domain-containing protein [uncultured Dysgonomonas sp.]|uniref:Fibrobacter succinogenes major paralogous domain-containing protein n=1 Tax=uncultured Dysgonomonas sp. TaxID=206096 RepID=A0A212JKU8_9BACT|nr:FISUMP domain-containing protein [uncultured Dysgonomonas sp.]SBW00052.1 exported hypothetical protein [uncultured Dysgonomonas sp.]
MKTLYSKLFIPVLAGFFSYYNANAQVTIGSTILPSEGAILDLKENQPTVNNTNATKGLMLPRVKLTSNADLFPMFLGDTDYENNTSSKKDSEDKSHTGLTVYNINLDICEEIYPGVYTWDGNEWILLSEGIFPSETDILVDNRNSAKPEQYKIGKFADAGWWMLENLRADRWPDGTNNGLVFDYPVMETDPTYLEPRFYYPRGSQSDLGTNPHYGYMYNLMAATKLTRTEIGNTTHLIGIQGICPDGWHLPTLDEWWELRDAVEANPCQYAHSKIGANTGWNMQSMENNSNGVSRSREQGGFNGILLGRMSRDQKTGEISLGYNKQTAFFWVGATNSVLGTQAAALDKNTYAAARMPHIDVYLLSVRCKKD